MLYYCLDPKCALFIISGVYVIFIWWFIFQNNIILEYPSMIIRILLLFVVSTLGSAQELLALISGIGSESAQNTESQEMNLSWPRARWVSYVLYCHSSSLNTFYCDRDICYSYFQSLLYYENHYSGVLYNRN